MSTTVTYKGSTLTTVNNQTRTLKTAGKYMEGDVILTDISAGAPNVWQDQDGYVHLDDEGTSPISVEALSVTQNGTYTAPTGTAYSPVTVNVSGNVVTGTFTGTTTGAVMDIPLNYTGSGYPIAVMIYPTGGAYNADASSGSNAYIWYNLIQRFAIGFWSMIKCDPAQVPFQGITNKGIVESVYKSQADSATGYTRNGTMSTDIYTSNNPYAYSTSVVSIKSPTLMSVFIASTSYGFAANIEYTYHIIYSL